MSTDSLPYSFKQDMNLTYNTSVQLTGEVNGTFTMAYEERSGGSGLGAMIDTYYELPTGEQFEIFFDASTYSGKPFFVDYDNKVYYGEFNQSATVTRHKMEEVVAYTYTRTHPVEKP